MAFNLVEKYKQLLSSPTGQFVSGVAEGAKRIVNPYKNLLSSAGYTVGSEINRRLAETDILPDSFQRRQAGIAQTQAELALQMRKNMGTTGSGLTTGGAKTAFVGAGATARPMLAAVGLANPAQATFTGLLSGGIAYGAGKIGERFGGKPATPRDIGRAIGYSPVYGGINKLTGGFQESLASSLGGANWLQRGLAKGGVFAIGNILEDEVFTRLLEGRAPTNQERIIAGGTGLGSGIGAEAFSSAMKSIKGVVKKLKPDLPEKEVTVVAGRFLKNEAGRLVGSRKKEPVFYGDLREGLGLPRDSNYIDEINIGLGIKPIKSTQQPLSVKQTTKQTKVVTKQADEIKTKGVFNWIDDIRQRLENEYHPLEKAAKIVKKGGKELKTLEDPEYLVKRNLGSVGIAEGELLGFGDIIRPYADSTDELSEYLIAKRAIDLSGRDIETGLKLADAQATVAKLEPKYKQVAEQLYMYQRSILQNYLVDTGMLSPDQFKNITEANSNYVPFKRLLEEAGIDVVPKKKGGSPIKRIKGSEKEILNPLESIIENTYKAVTAGENNRLWRSVASLGKLNPNLGIKKVKTKMVPVANVDGKAIFRPSTFNPKPNTISIFENGKRVFYEVPPEIAMVANEMGNSLNIFVKLLSVPTKIVRTGATGINPEFGLFRNPLRDQFTALWNSEAGYKPFLDLFKGISHYSGQDDLYRRYLLSGAGNSYMVSLDKTFKNRTLKELISGKTVIKKGGLISKLQDISQLTEIGTRLGEFGKAEKKFGSLEAGKAAREITVDFSRIGKDFRVANQLIPFINARLQGTIQAVKSALNHPVRSSVIGLSLGSVPAVLTYLHNRQYPEYFGLEDYEKENNWIIMFGKPGSATPVSIPKDFIIGKLFGNTTENFLSWADSTDPNALNKLAVNILDVFSPVSGPGDVIPAGIKPIAEDYFNYSTFLGRPIVPEYQKALPPEAQYNAGTRELAKIIGAKIGVSPAKIDNYLYGYGPGVFSEVINLVDFALGGKKFDEVEKLPFVRVFGVSGTGKLDREIKNSYYEIQDIQKTISSIKKSQNYTDEQKEYLIEKQVKKIGEIASTMNTYEKLQSGDVSARFGDAEPIGQMPLDVKSPVGEAGATGEMPTMPKDEATIKELYKDANSRIKSLENRLITLPYEPRQSYEEYSRKYDIEQAEKDLAMWRDLKDKVETDNPDMVFELQLENYGENHPSSVKVEDRAKWAAELIQKTPDFQRQDLINVLWEEGVLTSKSNGTSQYIKDNYGLDVSNYTGEGEYGAKAKKAKKPPSLSVSKIAIPKVSVPKVKKTTVRRPSRYTKKYKLTRAKVSAPKIITTSLSKWTPKVSPNKGRI